MAKYCILMFALAGIMSVNVQAADKIAGFREKTGVHVPSGTVTETDNVILSGDGEFYKTGAGTYVLPGAKLNQQRPVNLVVTDGTLKLQAGADETIDATTPPAVMQDASFWVDVGRNVVTEESDGATRVTRWCDVRETNTATPTMGYAVPAWKAEDEGYATHYNIKPALVTKDGTPSVYFGGAQSGQYMNFVTAAGANRTLNRVKHAFVVHGVYECLGAVIGGRTSNHGVWLRWAKKGLITVPELRTLKAHIENYRSDKAPMMLPARWYLDGVPIDLARTMPELGKFQLLAADWPTREMQVSCFYNQQGVSHTAGASTLRGGDYLTEAVFFERQLSEVERLTVESYLMKKWNLGADKLAKGQVPVDPSKPAEDTFFTNGVWTTRLSGNVAVARGATFEVEAAAGVKSPIVSLTGEGSVVKTGEGSLQIGAQKGEAFTGDIELCSGVIDVRGGAYPILKAVAGKTVTGTASGNLSLYSNPTNQYESSARYSVQNGSAGIFTKYGNEPLAVSKVDAGVKKLSVAQGQLQLVGPRAVEVVDDSKTLSADDLHVNIVDPGFEHMTVTNGDYYVHSASASEIYGWTGKGGIHYLLSKSDGVTLPDYNASSWNYWIARKPVEGDACFKLNTQWGTASLKQELSFPNDGRYTLSFYMISMIASGWNYTQQPLLVKLDDKVVGHAFGGLYGWWRCYIDLGTVSAGLHELVFSYDPKVCKSLICLDDVRIDFTGTKRSAVADYAIPYGDFEEWETSTEYYPNVGDYNHAKGWTLTSTDVSLANQRFPVCVATDAACFANNTSATTTFSDTRLLSIRSKDKRGCSYLAFFGSAGRASTEFTAPRGIWFLKAKIAHDRGYFLSGMGSYDSDFVLQATLTRADSTVVDLGTVTAAGTVFDEVIWTNRVEFEADENVTLTLAAVNKSIGAIDDLRLGFADVNLVQNGGFENGTTGWKTLTDKSVYNNVSAAVIDVVSESQWDGRENGYCAYDGTKYLRLMNTATAYQDIDFPEPGYYRLSFAARSRVQVSGYGMNLLTIWQGGDDMGAIATNRIVQVHPDTMNFVEHSYLFYVPTKGLRRIGISGEGNPGAEITSGNQSTSVIDAFSIVRATDIAPDAVPDVPKGMMVSVDEGATLNLDFPGTLKCGEVKLGGTVVQGLVNARTYPQYITGVGSIVSIPKGFMMILR